MNCASDPSPLRRWRRGFTLIEMLLAIAIAMAFLSGVYVIFIETLQAYERIEARSVAMRNARTAINTLSDEIRQISRLSSDVLLIGTDNTYSFGDGIDNDFDGNVDEEIFNGLDDDNGTGSAASALDQHATLGDYRERPEMIGAADFGDLDVDEDCNFGADFLIFRIYPSEPTQFLQYKTVTYAVTSWDGEDNVLVRQTRIEFSDGTATLGVAPIAFGVLGFDVLYWNPNADPEDQGWVTTWDSGDVANFEEPRLPLPASLLIRLTLDADSDPRGVLDGNARETYVAQTMLNIEQTIDDALFPRPTL